MGHFANRLRQSIQCERSRGQSIQHQTSVAIVSSRGISKHFHLTNRGSMPYDEEKRATPKEGAACAMFAEVGYLCSRLPARR